MLRPCALARGVSNLHGSSAPGGALTPGGALERGAAVPRAAIPVRQIPRATITRRPLTRPIIGADIASRLAKDNLSYYEMLAAAISCIAGI